MTDNTENMPAMMPETPPPAGTPFDSLQSFELGQRMAKALASSMLIPTAFQGKTADCMLALEIAHRLQVSPLAVLQNIYMVHGKPSFSAKFMISAFNASPDFGPLRYEQKGDEGTMSRGCRALAFDKVQNKPVYGPWITMDLAKAEGWLGKKGSKWQTMPEKMLMYRAAAWFIDTYAPELMIAAPSMDGELIEVEPIVLDPDKDQSMLSQAMGEVVDRRKNGKELGEVLTKEQASAREKDLEPESY